MNVKLKALNTEIANQEKDLKIIEKALKELREARGEEARAEQKRLIKLFNRNPFVKLAELHPRLPKDHIVSGFESDTYLHSELKICISRGQYTFDFVVKGGEIKYENRRSNDGVGTNNSEEIIDLIDRILNKEV